ncbi:hypothetical protein [Caenimonas aquaedulcis]|uniref:Uncharacterized protein n=1 Tax=Caenimonas aquaedulcis TaxID=2793270 RepID=A0A931ME57_9BURK|nr:hypothetical protein [Caenimonas aquaedulcis]MBG9386536.1 hypothetical protein [Caenimonas aquaedulcis]
MNAPLWAITSYFNPLGSRRRLDNYRHFRRHLRAPLLAVELSFGEGPHLARGDADILVQCRDGDLLWQKERLLNRALQSLPASCRFVAWVDCDVVFEDPHWPLQAGDLLERNTLVQLFRTVRHALPDADVDALQADRRGWEQPSLASCMPVASDAGAPLSACMRRESGTPTPGMAWAARRAWLETHGLYDRCIVGGGDTAFAGAALGCPEVVMELHRMNTAQRTAYREWARGVRAVSAGRLPHLEGRLHHLWHGNIADRHASARHAGLAPHDYDPRRDLAPGRDGAWRWAGAGTGLRRYVQGYFAARREDGGEERAPVRD